MEVDAIIVANWGFVIHGQSSALILRHVESIASQKMTQTQLELTNALCGSDEIKHSDATLKRQSPPSR